jgi:glycosyltransferase involved in cell wall biosynthesis
VDPLVSIVIPTWRGSPWIRATLASACAQTFSDLEVVVVDDASDDDTVARAREATADPRVRVIACARNAGIPGNWNRAIACARGRFVKFLLQDDLLHPRCVERLVAPALAREDVDLVFAPRDLLFDEPASPEAAAFLATNAAVHRAFPRLLPVNPRGTLAAAWIAARCLGNWIGEPTAVLVRRAAFARHGGFHIRMRQLVDMEMWARLAFHGAAAFVDEPLATFRVHARSASARQTAAGLDWLDRLELLDGLLRDPAIASAHPELRRWRRGEERRVLRRVARPWVGGPRLATRRTLAGLRGHVADRIRRLAGRGGVVHAPIDVRIIRAAR